MPISVLLCFLDNMLPNLLVIEFFEVMVLD